MRREDNETRSSNEGAALKRTKCEERKMLRTKFKKYITDIIVLKYWQSAWGWRRKR